MLAEIIQDICHFLITFHTPVSLSAPHIYISGQAFLPSQSPLSRIFNREFTRPIKVRVGKPSSWSGPAVGWIGDAEFTQSMISSPNGARMVTESDDNTIPIRDATSAAAVGEDLTGHDGVVFSVVYSPDGCRIISGSSDGTI